MKATLLGIKTVDFKNDDGERIAGTQLFLSFKSPKVIGLETRKFFLTDEVYANVVFIDLKDFLSKEIDVDTNFDGKISSISA